MVATAVSALLIVKELTSLEKEANHVEDQSFSNHRLDLPEEKEDNLDATDDGESSEEPHGASDEAQLGLHLDLLVSLDVVEGGRVKVDLHQLKS